MRTTAFALLKLLLALLSVLALVGVNFIPAVTLTLHPGERAAPSLYGPIELVSWLDRRHHSWRCEYGPEFSDEHCGVVLNWDNLEPVAACTKKVTDPDGDGWDWEDGRSCVVYRQVSSRPQRSPFHTCSSPEADIDGDGWGWEKGSTCKVADVSHRQQVVTAEGRWPYCASGSSDPDGDGWGWEQEQSCVVRGSAADPNLKRPSVNIAQVPYCNSATSDPDGDGWGWENQRSCVVRDGPVDSNNKSPETMPVGVDFSQYHALRIAIQYEGRAEYVRVFLRNFNPAYADPQQLDSTKFMAATLLTKNLKAGPATLPFSEFSVAQWWLQHLEKPQRYAAPEFNNIVSLGFDYVEPGVHKMHLDKVELVGKRLSFATVLYSLCAFWVVFIGSSQVWQWRQRRRQAQPHSAMANIAAAPEQHPPSSLERAYQNIKHRTPVGLLVLEIDHLQSIKQHCGSELCADLCAELQQLITAGETPIQHIAPTAEGQCCALLCDANLEKVEAEAERLRYCVAHHSFNKELKLSITISVGFTLIMEDDAFAEAMKRAEWALFQAMKTRNTICSYPR